MFILEQTNGQTIWIIWWINIIGECVQCQWIQDQQICTLSSQFYTPVSICSPNKDNMGRHQVYYGHVHFLFRKPYSTCLDNLELKPSFAEFNLSFNWVATEINLMLFFGIYSVKELNKALSVRLNWVAAEFKPAQQEVSNAFILGGTPWSDQLKLGWSEHNSRRKSEQNLASLHWDEAELKLRSSWVEAKHPVQGKTTL